MNNRKNPLNFMEQELKKLDEKEKEKNEFLEEIEKSEEIGTSPKPKIITPQPIEIAKEEKTHEQTREYRIHDRAVPKKRKSKHFTLYLNISNVEKLEELRNLNLEKYGDDRSIAKLINLCIAKAAPELIETIKKEK